MVQILPSLFYPYFEVSLKMKEMFTVHIFIYDIREKWKKAEMSYNYFEACQRSFYIAKYLNKKKKSFLLWLVLSLSKWNWFGFMFKTKMGIIFLLSHIATEINMNVTNQTA